MDRYDFAVAGAGPAGSAFTLLAARAGYRVLLTEQSRFTAPRFGETAPPELRIALTRIGLDRLAKPPFCNDAPALISVWGSDRPASRNHIVSPYGNGLHLDRRAFDEALASAARDAGADLKLGHAVRFVPRAGNGYAVLLEGGERACARFAILATGRTGGNLGLPYARRYLDNHIAVAAHFDSPIGTAEMPMLVEATPGGWFYFAASPAGKFVVVLVTSASLVPAGRDARLRWWLEELAGTRLVRSALNGCPVPRTLSVVDARGSCAQRGGGRDWLAIGDARIAPDPLSGQGIHWAINDAETVAELMSNLELSAIAEHMQAKTEREVRQYLNDRQEAYARERRFASDPYWAAACSQGDEIVAVSTPDLRKPLPDRPRA
jgi:flavin-dependent dehydrogenase